MRANSLALRLFFSAAAWTVAILLATGILLSSLYREAVERSFDRRLTVYLRTIVAEITTADLSTERISQTLGEPLFDLPLSGWYWQVSRLSAVRPEGRSSRSLWDKGLPHLDEMGMTATADGTRHGNSSGPEDQQLRIVERIADFGEDGRFRVAVAGDTAEIEDETRSFDRALMITLGALAIVLVLTTAFQVRFGLAPLKRISAGLAAIRSGQAERLVGAFPVEIDPLARETNELLEANREIVERARTHVGNLAHALKTPLSVVINEVGALGNDPATAKIREQTTIMRDQIARHLERARLAARTTVVGTVTDVAPVVTALTRTMEKLHRDRTIAVNVVAPLAVRFRGERQDLEEMVGNLVDNACKWAQARVNVEIVPEQGLAVTARRVVRIVVDDDGRGLSPAERERVTRRGQRLDETMPGSGLGLSIVLELAALYGGHLTLGSAPIGGLRAELSLPAA
ncbi:MAG: sensor histidine kinase [Proteobacteria bacterium]|nr:sensor histidine kinase [Pseudomonadota bacterium]